MAVARRQGVRVRRGASADLPTLLPIWLEMMRLHETENSAFVLAADAEPRWRGWVSELMARPEAFVLVAQLSGGAVAGFAVGWLADNLPIYAEREVGFISELAVAPWARRRGVGSRLLASCRAWFARRGMREFQLATAVWNRDAQAFWEASGGVPVLLRYRFAGLAAAAVDRDAGEA